MKISELPVVPGFRPLGAEEVIKSGDYFVHRSGLVEDKVDATSAVGRKAEIYFAYSDSFHIYRRTNALPRRLEGS
jgi:hypothetical protein